jgi:hypothetical protein
MTFRGFLVRLVYVALFTWIVGAIIESFSWGLYFAILPFLFWEMLRPRPLRNPQPRPPRTPSSPDNPPTHRLP